MSESFNPEPCKDVISRKDAIAELIEMTEQHKDDQFGGQLIHWTGVKAMLECLPSVTPQPKTGKWIITSKFDDCYYAHCDQCNVTQVFYFGKPTTNFCPNCGAKMEGTE